MKISYLIIFGLIFFSIFGACESEMNDQKEYNKQNNIYKEVPCYDNHDKIIENTICKDYNNPSVHLTFIYVISLLCFVVITILLIPMALTED